MASAQQKPKKEKGSRNSSRHNGKAFKRRETPFGTGPQDKTLMLQVVDNARVLYDQHQPRVEVKTRDVLYKGNGVQVSGKGKPSGASYLGVSYKRIRAQAYTRGVTVEAVKAELLAKRESRKTHRHVLTQKQRTSMHQELMSRGDKPRPRSKQSAEELAKINKDNLKKFTYTGD